MSWRVRVGLRSEPDPLAFDDRASYGGVVADLEDVSVYRDQTVRLADLAALEDVLTGLTLENCEIVGPAVVVLLGDTKVTDCHWTGDADAVLWPGHGREQVVGAIGLKDCVITDCEFFRVGLLVPDEQLPTVRAGFGLA